MGANPVDRGKPGSKLHLVCDGGGLPLTAVVTGANVAAVTMLAAVVDDIPPVRTPAGGGVSDPTKSTRTRGMTAAPTVPTCAVVGSSRGLPGVGWSRRPGWAATVASGAVAVVAWLLAAAAAAVGSRLGAVVRVILLPCAVVCFNRLEFEVGTRRRAGRCGC